MNRTDRSKLATMSADLSQNIYYYKDNNNERKAVDLSDKSKIF